jgi:NAD(P)H-hydrate epimerase
VRPVLLPAEARELDRASQARGIGASDLMEAAGGEVADAARRLLGGVYGRRAAVVCGPGNNGGDGLVAARHLAAAGVGTTVILLEDPEAFGEPAGSNLRALRATPARIRPASTAVLGRELGRAGVVVDAIFGTGFHGVAAGAAAQAIAAINAARVPVVAVDIPSGVDGGTGAVEGEAVRADLTVTFGAPKPGVILFPGAALAGVVEVEPIGFPPDLIRGEIELVEPEDVAAWLPTREAESHKRSAGYGVVIAGSRSMTGAAALAGRGAYAAGAGLVAVAVPEGILPVLQGLLTEAVFVPLPETAEGAASGGSARLDDVLAQAGALAIGPGMTANETTAAWVREVLRASEIPVVLDADGLNAFAGRPEDLADRKAEIVLTPHAGEFARLAGIGAADVVRDRIARVRELAGRTGAVVLLKGSRTVIGTPDGRIRIVATGGPFLATGGTGDVLTGMIVALLAGGLAPADAAAAAAFVHGVAGRTAAEGRSGRITAGDVVARIPEAIEEIAG